VPHNNTRTFYENVEEESSLIMVVYKKLALAIRDIIMDIKGKS
jgi:hypothetical protein